MTSSTEFALRLPATIRKSGSMYVAWCPALDVGSCGETRERARANLAEALRLFVADCSARGTLDQVLRDCGLPVPPPPENH